MKIIKDRAGFDGFLELLKGRGGLGHGDIPESVAAILDGVRKGGDAALSRYTIEFDRVTLTNISLSNEIIKENADKVDKGFLKALKLSARRIEAFHKKQLEKSWTYTRGGATLGQIIRPLERVGIYIPGGKAAYPSTVLMNAIPAMVAGVSEIAVCVPTPDGVINPHVMAAINLLGLKEVHPIGGAQAVGALAYGTKSIRKVDKIVGPGNIYVAVAKKMVYGDVDIDMIAGPSEILIVADKTADPTLVAADLLSQAEHDEMASSILITTHEPLIDKVKVELYRQLDLLDRAEIARRSIESYCALIYAPDIETAFEYSNKIAPEHLEVMMENPMERLPLIKNAGAIFMGQWTPEALGDYSAGPNHTLPTGSTSRFSSPLGVYDFLKRSSLLHFTQDGFRKLAPYVEKFADVEGLTAHGNTVRLRRRLLS